MKITKQFKSKPIDAGRAPMISDSYDRRNQVKITKRQLKTIIREEYSRLKRQGLLREFGMGDVHIEIQNAIIEAIQDIMSIRGNMRGATREDIELYINNPRSSVQISSGYVPDYEEIAVVVDDMVAAGDLMEDAAGFLTLTDGYM